MAHKRKVRRVDPAQPHKLNQETQPRNNDTGNQMRDAVGIARAAHARRFDADSIIKQRLESLRRQDIEDLRRNRRERRDIGYQTYQNIEGRAVPVYGREVYTPEMQRAGMHPRLQYVFQDSRGTLVCQRRRTRRSVLFALRKTGRGGKRNRRARWTEKSYLVCRRVR